MPDEFKPLPSHLPTIDELIQEFTPSRRQAASMLESLLPPPPHAILRHDKNAHQPQPEEWIRREREQEYEEGPPAVIADVSSVPEHGEESEEEVEEAGVPDSDAHDMPVAERPHIRVIIVSGTSLI